MIRLSPLWPFMAAMMILFAAQFQSPDGPLATTIDRPTMAPPGSRTANWRHEGNA
jgi:hypothetical protein